MGMKTMKMVLIALTLCSFTTANAQGTDSQPAQGSYLLPVEPGDSLLALFGPSWQVVYEQNKASFRARNAAAPSPNLLIEGTLLEVPENASLTPKAMARLSKVREKRDAIHARLGQLEMAGGKIGGEAALLDERLNSMRFVADLDFVTSAAETLEQARAVSIRERQTYKEGVAGAVMVLVLVVTLLAVVLFRRRRASYTGDARLASALSAIEKCA
jgi:hypothetical protein